MARNLINISVSQLTEYEKRRFNQNRICPVCSNIIHDYEQIVMITRRDMRKVEYAFAHNKCFNTNKNIDLFSIKKEV